MGSEEVRKWRKVRKVRKGSEASAECASADPYDGSLWILGRDDVFRHRD
jgi:hypothetical protein